MKPLAPKVQREDRERSEAEQRRPDERPPLPAAPLEQELAPHSGAAQQLELDRS